MCVCVHGNKTDIKKEVFGKWSIHLFCWLVLQNFAQPIKMLTNTERVCDAIERTASFYSFFTFYFSVLIFGSIFSWVWACVFLFLFPLLLFQIFVIFAVANESEWISKNKECRRFEFSLWKCCIVKCHNDK